jgi:ADP-ribosyl-[dinitrogen reductase] hydrolase
MDTLERFHGSLLGLACGDAVGTTVEFRPRGSFRPVTDMTGGGPFSLEPGQWTDDTSMALCLAASLVGRGGFDAADQMQRYCRWMDEGYLSATGECFDIGMTVSAALRRFQATGEPFSGSTHPRTAGNGCLMRLAPVPMFYFGDREAAIEHAGHSARTTHGSQECVEACRLFGAMLWLALSGAGKENILLGHGIIDLQSQRLASIAVGDYRKFDATAIGGNGYVVDSLEAALWCFAGTSTFEEAILCAANLGDDADTTAAICGQLAGAFYGATAIPEHWRSQLAMAGMIRELADGLFEYGTRTSDGGAGRPQDVVQGVVVNGVPCALVDNGLLRR